MTLQDNCKRDEIVNKSWDLLNKFMPNFDAKSDLYIATSDSVYYEITPTLFIIMIF